MVLCYEYSNSHNDFNSLLLTFVSSNRVNDATVKLDRIMECVMDTSAVDSESAPGVAQPNIDFRPPTRDTGALERRLARMEDNVASILETMKTLVDLAHSQKVFYPYLSLYIPHSNEKEGVF